jgi:hypothetical protein
MFGDRLILNRHDQIGNKIFILVLKKILLTHYQILTSEIPIIKMSPRF